MPALKTILVADDSEDDFVLLRSAFQLAGFSHKLIRVTDGEEVLELLQAEILAGNPPDLLILDGKMPKLDGFDVLRMLSECPNLRPRSVIMLSGSVLPEDQNRAAALGAAAYFSKPDHAPLYVALAREIDQRWLSSEQQEAWSIDDPAVTSSRLNERDTVA